MTFPLRNCFSLFISVLFEVREILVGAARECRCGESHWSANHYFAIILRGARGQEGEMEGKVQRDKDEGKGKSAKEMGKGGKGAQGENRNFRATLIELTTQLICINERFCN